MKNWGEWIGHYPGHHSEVVAITQTEHLLEATKVTGDDYVPAGEVTWRFDLQTMTGLGCISELGFRNPRWVDGKLVVLGRDRLRFEWGEHGAVEFRADDI